MPRSEEDQSRKERETGHERVKWETMPRSEEGQSRKERETGHERVK